MKCANPTCDNEVKQPAHANQVKLFCSMECRQADYNRYLWHTNERKRLRAQEREDAGKFKFRDPEDCGIDPPLPIERAYVQYCIRCLPKAPTYDFEDWYDIHLTYGAIDW